MASPGVDFRFIFSNPKDLWRGKTCQSDIAADLDKSFLANPLMDLVTLCLTALVIPQNGGAQHLTLCVQQYQAVHLTGETNRLNFA